MIHFNVPPFVGTEFKYMHEAVENHKICGDGPFTKKCDEWLENRFKAERVMLTTSGSTATRSSSQKATCTSMQFAARFVRTESSTPANFGSR